jgi:uncharacterized repeat protein (TIGR02543 family)
MGWNTAENGSGTAFTVSTTVTGNITVYAQWRAMTLRERILAAAGTTVTITVYAGDDTNLAPIILNTAGTNITLVGDGAMKTIQLTGAGNLFFIKSGAALTLGSNITLQGIATNTAPLVYVETGGILVLADGCAISGNKGFIFGGGVYVSKNGTFTMNGGTITGNHASDNGGGVLNFGTFTMNGGTITGNESMHYGGGVLNGGTFTKNGGTISGNTADRGGGVSNDASTFIMNGGNINDNSSAHDGGGVLNFSMFTMSGGTITGNHSYSGGGGVRNIGTFIMSGGNINGNTATYGGGVYVSKNGTFTMSGGTITGDNNATVCGNTLWRLGPTAKYGGSYGTGNILADNSTEAGTSRPLPYDNGDGGDKDPAPLN